MNLDQFLETMWIDYCKLNPDAKKIYDLLVSAGEEVGNDHIALRTIRHPRLGLQGAVRQFEKLGYELKGQDYVFKNKKLYARHMEHKQGNYPKVFISELELEKMSPFVTATLLNLVGQIPEKVTENPEFYFSGRPWSLTHSTYEALAKESEYAAWLAAFGFRPNHFTVNVNQLRRFSDLKELNAFVKAQGFVLNQSGGEIKGAPEHHLEQSSTMASEIPVTFSDGVHLIPGCYYEFAKRYALPDGQLYSGFIANSADRIFESTNKRKA